MSGGGAGAGGPRPALLKPVFVAILLPMYFLRALLSSLYDPEFYAHMLSGEPEWSFGASMAYFVTFGALLALLSMVGSLFFVVPLAKETLKTASGELLAAYPSALVVSLKGGVASSSVVEPFFIDQKNATTTSGFSSVAVATSTHLAVIDTKDIYSPELAAKYDTIFLLARDVVAIKTDQGDVSTIDLSRVRDGVVSRELLSRWIDELTQSAPILVPLLLVTIFLFSLMAHLLQLFAFLVYAALLFFMLRLWKKPLSYKKSFQYMLHLSTLPILVTWALAYLSPGFEIPFLYELLLIGVTCANLAHFITHAD